MNIHNLNLQKNKKTLVLIFCCILAIIIFHVSEKMTNHKLSNSVVLSYLYLKNSENISFNNVLLKVPFCYVRSQDKDNLTLLKYPPGGGLIFFNKTRLSQKSFDQRVECLLSSKNFNVVSKGEIKIDNEHCYFITLTNTSNQLEYSTYINIPNKSITIDFIGEKDDAVTFWKIIKQIRFVS